MDNSITKRHAAASEGTVASEAQEMNEKDKEIRALVQERKTIAKHEKERIREVNKKIKKCITDNKRKTRQEKIQKILSKLKGTRNILSTKSVKKRILIPKITNEEGETIKTRQGIADVFAKIYGDLYEGEEDFIEKGTDLLTEVEEEDPEQNDFIKEFTKNEIQDAIDRLKRGKAKDSNGIRAEQLKKLQ